MTGNERSQYHLVELILGNIPLNRGSCRSLPDEGKFRPQQELTY